MKDIKNHTRVNDILLGPLERPALAWLAAHMPAWVTPDFLTGLGIFGSVIIFASYALTFFDKNFLWLASFGFVLNWFGDSLDGTLARFRHIQRPKYGFFIDHVMDAISEVLVFVGLGLSPYVRLDIACLALIGYLLMSILVYVRTCVVGEFRISYIRLGPTEMRVMAIMANTLVFFAGNPLVKVPLFGQATIYDWIVLLIAVLLMAIFVVSTMVQASQLANVDEVEKRYPVMGEAPEKVQ
jgi:archaetidylinositol phosphate synthase